MRPTKYDPKMVEQAEKYCKEYQAHDHLIPSLVGFASTIGVTEKTLHNWSDDEDKADFLQSLQRIKDKQHLVLLNKGLSGEFNSALTKLLLFNHGYSDKQQINDPNNEPVRVVYIQNEF